MDETDIPSVQDRPDGEDHDRRAAGPDLHRQGDRDRQQPDPDRRAATSAGQQATNFKVTVQIDGQIAGGAARVHLLGRRSRRPRARRCCRCRSRRWRPARWSTTRAARSCASRRTRRAKRAPQGRSRRVVAAAGRAASQARRGRKSEGVFVIATTDAQFVPVKVGIAGDKYFEVLSGLKDGDQVITGPFNYGAQPEGRRRGEDRNDEGQEGQRPRRSQGQPLAR